MNVVLKRQISAAEYLQGELLAEIKHELIAGEVFAMAGASKKHERIIVNLSAKLQPHLLSSACDTFSSDIKVKVGHDFFYPDLMVVCNEQTENDNYTESPSIIVEVLSKSTRRLDETIKRLAYQTIPSLQEYILIEQDFVDIEVCRRSQGWLPSHYFLGDEFTLEVIGLNVRVAELYHRVQNDDMQAFLAELTL